MRAPIQHIRNAFPHNINARPKINPTALKRAYTSPISSREALGRPKPNSEEMRFERDAVEVREERHRSFGEMKGNRRSPGLDLAQPARQSGNVDKALSALGNPSVMGSVLAGGVRADGYINPSCLTRMASRGDPNASCRRRLSQQIARGALRRTPAKITFRSASPKRAPLSRLLRALTKASPRRSIRVRRRTAFNNPSPHRGAHAAS